MKNLMMGLLTIGFLTTGCASMEASTEVGRTQIRYKGTSTNPEALLAETGRFVQRTTAAQTEQELVRSGRMPYYRGGCQGNRCWRHYGQNVAPPLPGGRYDRSGEEETSEETSGGDNAAELEAAREEAAKAKRERDEAIEALAGVVREAEGQ